MVEHLAATRVVAAPAAIDGVDLPADRPAMRLAPDELLIIGHGSIEVADAHAIIAEDAGWSGIWLDADDAAEFLRHACEWELPDSRPAFAQGMIAQLAAKLWLEADRTLIVVPTPMAAELVARLGELP